MASVAGFSGPFVMKGLGGGGYSNSRSITNYNSVYESFKSREVITSLIKSSTESSGVYISNLYCNSITAGTGIINNLYFSNGVFTDISVGTGTFNTIIAGTGIFSNLSFTSADIPSITAGTGIISDIFANNITTNTIKAGTGTLQISNLSIGTGTFININAGTGTINNLISSNIQSQIANITTLQVGTGIFTNITGPVASTNSTGVLSYQDWNLFNLGIQTQNVICVQKNPNRYEFLTISSAIAYANTLSPSMSNPITISVGPGVYVEPLLTVPSFVRLIGSMGSTFIIPNGPHNIVNLSEQSSITSCVLLNAQSTYCAVYANDTAVYSQASDLYISNCDIGIKLKTTAIASIIYCSRVIITGTFTQGLVIDCTSGLQGSMNINGAAILPLSNSVLYGVNCSGNYYFIGSALTNTGNGNGTMFNFNGNGYSFVVSTIVNNWNTFMNLSGTNYSNNTNGAANVDCLNGIIATGTGNCIFTGVSFTSTTLIQLNIGANVSGYYSGPFTRSKIIINPSSNFTISNEDLHIIKVAKVGGNFNSIKAACDFITDASINNRYLVLVGPGIYIEDMIDLSTKPYISVYGQIIQSIVIKPSSPNQHIFSIGAFNELSFLWLEGTGPGYAGIAVLNSGDYSLAHKITFNNCDIGILITSDSIVTEFYGEYIDMNGTFSYATKIQTTNTGSVFVNLENYYPIPNSLTTQSIGTYISGSGAEVCITTAGCRGFGLGKAFVVENGANLLIQSTNIENWSTGIEVTNTAGIPLLNVDGVYLNNNTQDISILNSSTKGTFSGNADITKISNSSSNFYWGFLDTTTGSFQITNKLNMTFPNQVNTDLTTSLIECTTTGLLSGGVITISSGLTISVSAGYGYTEILESGVRTLYKVTWNTQTLTLPANSENYIYFTKLGVLSYLTAMPDIISNVFIGRVVTTSSSVMFIDTTDMNAEHYSNANFTYLLNAIGPVYTSGSIATENKTPFKLDVSSGNYYVATVPFNPSGGTSISFTQFNFNGSSTWQLTPTTIVNNTQYNNGTTLTNLTSSYYAKHSLYLVGEGVNEQYFLVLAQQQYSSLAAAEVSPIPNPPDYFVNGVVLIAGIVIQQGASTISSIVDQRPVVGYRATGTTSSGDHQALYNRDVLTAHTQYLLKNNPDSMGINLDMGTFNIVNVSNISDTTNPLQNMIPTSHAFRHLPNGQDPLTTSSPLTNLSSTTTNGTGTANSFSRSDHTHAIDSYAINGTNTLMKRDNNGSTTLSYLNLNNTSNQIIIGTGILSTMNFSVPSINNRLTIPDTNGDTTFIMGKTVTYTQNINGLLTLSSTGSYNSGFVVGNNTYSTNTASQTGFIVTGVSTTFNSQMIGGIIRFADGYQSFITDFIDSLNLVAKPSQSISQQTYTIYYSGSQFDSLGNAGFSYLYCNTGIFSNLSATNLNIGTGSFNNLTATTSNIGTGTFISSTTGTGTFTNLISSNSNIGTGTFISSTTGTGTFTNLRSSNSNIGTGTFILSTTGTGIINNLFSSITNIGTGTFITSTTGTGIINNLFSSNIIAGTGNFITETSGTGIFTNIFSENSNIGTGVFNNLTSNNIISTTLNVGVGNIGTGNFITINSGTGTINSFNSTSSNITNLTSNSVISNTLISAIGNIGTGTFISINAGTGSFTNMNIGTGTFSNITSGTGIFTNLFSSIGNIGTGTFISLTSGTGTFNSLTSATGIFTNLRASTENIGTGSFISLTSGTGIINSLTSATGIFTNLRASTENIGTGSFISLTSGTGIITSLISLIGNIGTGSFISLTSGTGSFTSLTSSSITSGTGNFITMNNGIGIINNLFSANTNIGTGNFITLTAGTGNFTNLSLSNLNVGTGSFITLTSGTGIFTNSFISNVNIGTGSFITLNSSTGIINNLFTSTITSGTGSFININSSSGTFGSLNIGTGLFTSISTGTGTFINSYSAIGTIGTGTMITLNGGTGTFISLSSQTGIINNLFSSIGNIGTGIFTNLTSNNIVSTTLNVGVGNIGTGNFITLNSGTGTINNFTSSNSTIGTGNFISLNASTGTFNNLIVSGSMSINSLTTGTGIFTNLFSSISNIGTGSFISSTIGTGIINTLFSSIGNIGTGTIVTLNVGTGTFISLNSGTGTINNLFSSNVNIGTGTFISSTIGTGTINNLFSSVSNIGTGTFISLNSGTGIINNLFSANSNVGTGTFISSTIGTGIINNLVSSVANIGTGTFITLSVGTGTFANLNLSSINVGTGTFISVNSGTGIFTNTFSSIGNIGTGTFISLTSGTGIFTNTFSSIGNIGTGNFISLTSGTGSFTTLNTTNINVGNTLTSGTGVFTNLLSSNANIGTGTFITLNVGTGTFANLNLSSINVGTGTFISSTTGTGTFTNLISSNSNIGTGTFISLTSGTGIFTTLNTTTINVGNTLISGTGVFTNVISSNANIGTGTFITLTAGTGSFTNLSLSNINVNNGNIISLTSGTGIINNLFSGIGNIGTGTFISLTSGTGIINSLTSSIGNIGTGTFISLTSGTGIINSLTSSIGNIGTGNFNTLTSSIGNIGTGNFVTINSSTGTINTLFNSVSNIGTGNFITINAGTGIFSNLSSNSATVPSLIAGTGIINTLFSAVGTIGTGTMITLNGGTGTFNTITSATGIYTNIFSGNGNIGTGTFVSLTSGNIVSTTLNVGVGNIGTGNFITLNSGTSTINNFTSSIGNIGTGNFISLISGTGTFTTLNTTNINNVNTITAATGVFTNLFTSNITSGTGSFISMTSGSGIFNTMTSATGIHTNLFSSIGNIGTGTFITLNSGTGIINNLSSDTSTIGTGIFTNTFISNANIGTGTMITINSNTITLTDQNGVILDKPGGKQTLRNMGVSANQIIQIPDYNGTTEVIVSRTDKPGGQNITTALDLTGTNISFSGLAPNMVLHLDGTGKVSNDNDIIVRNLTATGNITMTGAGATNPDTGWTLGDLGTAGFAMMGNTTLGPTSSNYALSQNSSGDTNLNCLSTGQLRLCTGGTTRMSFFGNTITTPSGVGLTLGAALASQATTNQLVLGFGTTTTITSPAPVASRTYTIPDTAADSSFVMTDGAQTLNGTKTFSSAPRVNLATNQLILGTTQTVTINATAPTAARIYTIPNTNANSSFVMTDLAQTINGIKTFASAPRVNLASNQLTLGTTNVVTINAAAPTAARTYTIPDTAANSSFVMTDLAQTINGAKTFSAATIIQNSLNIGTTSTTTGLTLNNNTTSYVPTVLNYYEEFSTTFTFNDNGTNISSSSTLKIIRVGRQVTLQVYEMSTFDDTAPVRTNLISVTGVIPLRFRPLSNFAVGVHIYIGNFTLSFAKITTNGTIEVYTNEAITSTPTWLATTNAFYGLVASYNLN